MKTIKEIMEEHDIKYGVLRYRIKMLKLPRRFSDDVSKCPIRLFTEEEVEAIAGYDNGRG